jgi:hypothetical protein
MIWNGAIALRSNPEVVYFLPVQARRWPRRLGRPAPLTTPLGLTGWPPPKSATPPSCRL